MNEVTHYAELGTWLLGYVSDDANMFLIQTTITLCACLWLLKRAVHTLYRPVPELVSILGVEVPDAPAVSLAGIKADAVTLHWTHPGPHKPVVKYLIQVNGVNIGDSGRGETAITVTGLKPGHFYNVRVIAVGSSHFQAGSKVIRLRTYNRDGRPQLANGRVPANLSIEDQQNGALAESSDESAVAIRTQPSIEAAAVVNGTQLATRDPAATHPGPRRNTVGRKHSPSNAAADQAALATLLPQQPEESMQQLTERFEAIRKEMEELGIQGLKDAEDNKLQILELLSEKEKKKQTLKDKEEASGDLKKEASYCERANRQAQNRKTAKQNILRDVENERIKTQEDMVRWRNEIEEMKTKREIWEKEKVSATIQRETKTKELKALISEQHSALEGLEDEIREKGLRLKELEEDRKKLPGAEDDPEAHEREAAFAQSDREWDYKWEVLNSELTTRQNYLRSLQEKFHEQHTQLAAIHARQGQNAIMYHANSSGVDFDPSGQGKVKPRRARNHRKNRNNTMSSTGYGADEAQPGPSNYNIKSPAYVQGPYFDLSTTNDTAMVPLSELQMTGLSEAEVTAFTGGAPLSPSAHSLLPSNIFADDDPPVSRPDSARSLEPVFYAAADDGLPSPGSSSRSPSLLSSPHTSSYNLAKYGVSDYDYGFDADRRSLRSPRTNFGIIGGSSNGNDQPLIHKGIGNVKDLFTFPRTRGKTLDAGPALGSLKQGQSQSFPRSTDEPETLNSRARRMSSGWPSLFTRSSTTDATEGNAPAPARQVGARRRRGFNMFGGSSLDDPALLSERNPSSPRPVSIASSDLPRPSTDSAPFGWQPTTTDNANRASGASPLATNWSINAPQTWSRNPSRRPSFQHGSTTALASGLASDDDEVLPPGHLLGQASPTPIGVIGTRPPSSHKPITPKLNPAAPTFMAKLSSSFIKSEKSRGKEKEKGTEATAHDDAAYNFNTSSPTESRQSRDTTSIHTQHSMAESYESLERFSSSNAPSEPTPSASSVKDKESLFSRALMRKGSSSKFSLSSIRHKDSGFFGKKGGSSVANSDSAQRDSSFDELGEDEQLGRSFTSMTSSPMLGGGEWSGKGKDPGTPKEGRLGTSWGRVFKKKEKGRESLDVERSEAETTGGEEEG